MKIKWNSKVKDVAFIKCIIYSLEPNIAGTSCYKLLTQQSVFPESSSKIKSTINSHFSTSIISLGHHFTVLTITIILHNHLDNIHDCIFKVSVPTLFDISNKIPTTQMRYFLETFTLPLFQKHVLQKLRNTNLPTGPPNKWWFPPLSPF